MPNPYKVGKLKSQKSIKTVGKGANRFRIQGRSKKGPQQTNKNQRSAKGSMVKKSLDRAANKLFGW